MIFLNGKIIFDVIGTKKIDGNKQDLSSCNSFTFLPFSESYCENSGSFSSLSCILPTHHPVHIVSGPIHGRKASDMTAHSLARIPNSLRKLTTHVRLSKSSAQRKLDPRAKRPTMPRPKALRPKSSVRA